MWRIGFCALSWTFYGQFSSNFVFELILGRSGLGLLMGKFFSNKHRDIALDLWYNLVFVLYFGHFLSDSLQTFI